MILKNLKTIRQTKGLRQEDLAKQLKIKRQNISEYENGKGISLKYAQKIAKALNVSIVELTEDELYYIQVIRGGTVALWVSENDTFTADISKAIKFTNAESIGSDRYLCEDVKRISENIVTKQKLKEIK